MNHYNCSLSVTIPTPIPFSISYMYTHTHTHTHCKCSTARIEGETFAYIHHTGIDVACFLLLKTHKVKDFQTRTHEKKYQLSWGGSEP